MTSKLNNNSPMRGGSSTNRPTGAPSGGYSASVPISLYRQVAAELQATQALLDSLKVENQQLAQQNQQLRSAVEKVVQSALSLHQVAQSFQLTPPEPLPEAAQPDLLPEPTDTTRRSAGSAAKDQVAPFTFDPMRPAPIADELLTGQESRPRRPPKPERSSDLAGWKLTLVVMLIIVTFFGLGFAIVSPLLRNR
ncbi:MAG: hypothetical protein KME16_23940 [Scytolyngbya sp. HA4215-MV1]|jgi:hypothetical protein|nr:hypothetical protein [Scytolyngbya sp. HA4215-MV1]